MQLPWLLLLVLTPPCTKRNFKPQEFPQGTQDKDGTLWLRGTTPPRQLSLLGWAWETSWMENVKPLLSTLWGPDSGQQHLSHLGAKSRSRKVKPVALLSTHREKQMWAQTSGEIGKTSPILRAQVCSELRQQESTLRAEGPAEHEDSFQASAMTSWSWNHNLRSHKHIDKRAQNKTKHGPAIASWPWGQDRAGPGSLLPCGSAGLVAHAPPQLFTRKHPWNPWMVPMRLPPPFLAFTKLHVRTNEWTYT